MKEATVLRNWKEMQMLAKQGCGYDDWEEGTKSGPRKRRFASCARSICRWLRDDVLDGADGDIRFNPSGPAVSGDITLHTDHVYVNISADLHLQSHLGVMVRTCKHRKDYTGGSNHWVRGDADVAQLARLVKRLSDQSEQSKREPA